MRVQYDGWQCRARRGRFHCSDTLTDREFCYRTQTRDRFSFSLSGPQHDTFERIQGSFAHHCTRESLKHACFCPYTPHVVGVHVLSAYKGTSYIRYIRLQMYAAQMATNLRCCPPLRRCCPQVRLRMKVVPGGKLGVSSTICDCSANVCKSWSRREEVL